MGELTEFVETVVEEQALDDAARSRLSFQLTLVAEELFVNVCHYGHPNAPAVGVRTALAFDADGERVYFQMTDGGVAWDSLAHVGQTATAEGPVGGQGIRLVRSVMDRLSYERRGDENVLTMIKELA